MPRTPGTMTPMPSPTPAQLAEARRWLGKGDAAFHARRYDEAIAAYRGAIAANPAGIDARYHLGVALAARGELPGAIAAWEGVLLIDGAHEAARRNIEAARRKHPSGTPATPPPTDDTASFARAKALVDDGRWASATALLDSLLATPARTHDPATLSLRAEARLGAGDAAGAIVDWLAVLALDPRFARAYRGLADAYGLLGDAPRADYFRHLGTALAP
jgi:tetratricopeptide (TPR) repeat protein